MIKAVKGYTVCFDAKMQERRERVDKDFFLIQKIKKGSDDAVEEFVRKYYPVILKYCRYHTPDQQNAEDLTQETFARFFSSLHRYQHQGKTMNYLYVIAGNLCRDVCGHPPELLMEDWPETGVTPMEAVEEKVTLEQALWRLPEELREVIILYYFQNLKQKEIAGILGIGLPLVKYRISRAKELLRAELALGE